MTGSIQIPARGFTFDALAAGPADGEPVLLLHGFPQTPGSWSGVLAALGGAGYRAVAPAQRGYSPRARPGGRRAYRMAELTADVLAMADQLGAGRFHLAGHDWGAAVAWVLAARYPARVRTLTAVSTPHPRAMARALAGTQLLRSSYIPVFRVPGLAERLLGARGGRGLRALLTRNGLDPAAADAYVAAMREPGALTAALNWYRGALPFGVASRVTVPTLYVWGDRDQALGSRAARATGRWVDGAYRFEVVEGAGHWLPEQHADRLSGWMLELLSGPPRPGRG
jgi:pimeloyl-ACP methyl ester carboxylesterase